jgi:MoaA/NifB/PqqE/SkfB family radical SAM enzyme
MGLVLKKDYALIKDTGKAYIRLKKYTVPVSTKTAVFIALLNGSRSIEDAAAVMVAVNLCQPEQKDQLIENFLYQYGAFLDDCTVLGDNKNNQYDPRDFLLKNNGIISPADYTVPRSILFHVTNRCDKACRYCFLNAVPGSLETDALSYTRVCEIIDEAAGMGVHNIVYTGGEPFLRKDLFDIIKYAANKSISSTITTKYYLSENQIRTLGTIKNIRIGLSYDCHANGIASFLVGRPGHEEKMDQIIRWLVQNDIYFSVSPVITALTAPYFGEFVLHLKSLGVKNILVNRYIESPDGRNDRSLLVSENEWDKIKTIIAHTVDINISLFSAFCDINNVDNTGHLIKTDFFLSCVNGRSCLAVLHDGKVVICNDIPYNANYSFGDLKNSTIEEVWFSDKRKELIFPGQESYIGTLCHNCEEFDKCCLKNACIRRSLEENDAVHAPCSLTRLNCLHYQNQKE